MARSIRFRRIVTRTQEVAQSLGSLQFSQFLGSELTWSPAVNVYRYEDRMEVCVDLSGVEKEKIMVSAEPRRLVIRGFRPSPGPAGECGRPGSSCRQTLALEIENGLFEREITFPVAIDPDRVSARQENGLLWVSLPIL